MEKKKDKIMFITTAIYMATVHCFMSVNKIAVSSLALANDQLGAQICASSWSFVKVILRCTVSETSK